MIVDANVLLYASDSTSPHHDRAAAWLTGALRGDVRVGLPWQSIGAFLRISTHPRVMSQPVTPERASSVVENWFSSPVAWMPVPTVSTVRILAGLVQRYSISGNLVPDAQLAALAIEHGVAVASADTDFARFRELRWINPLTD